MTCVFLLVSIHVKWIPECLKIPEFIVLLEGGLLLIQLVITDTSTRCHHVTHGVQMFAVSS